MTPATSPAEAHAPATPGSALVDDLNAVARAVRFSLRRSAAAWSQVRGPVTLSLAGACLFASAVLTVLTAP
jgi:hypothetical protein